MKKVLFAVLALAATLFAQEGIERVSAITQVFSEGQKLTAAAVKFSAFSLLISFALLFASFAFLPHTLPFSSRSK